VHTSEQVAQKTGMSLPLVRRWARANSVPYVGEGQRKTYQWRDEDVKRFLNRDTKPGKRAKPKD